MAEARQSPEGGVMQLLKIALPLMLSALSGCFMMCADRYMLLRYDLSVHNAAVEAINLSWIFITGINLLAGITQTFVAQNYGAGKRGSKLSPFVWQMIWLSILSALIFWPLSQGTSLFFGSDISKEPQRIFLSWMLFFVPFHGMFNALAGFFIGQRETRFLSLVILFGNVLNTILGYSLIFGIEGWIPSMGIRGAVIGLNFSLVLQVIALFIAFMHKIRSFPDYRSYIRFDFALLKGCVKIGFPTSLFSVLETSGWFCFYAMMVQMGEKHLTIAGIVQNVLMFFFFVGVALSNAVSTLVGNAIGSNRLELTSKVVKSALMVACGCGVLMVGTLALGYQSICDNLLGNLPAEKYQLFYSALIFGLINSIIYKFLEWIRMIITGALVAAADTNFLLIAGAVSIWVFMVLPIYVFVVRLNGSIERALVICSLYTLLSALLYVWRFYTGAWRSKKSLVLQGI